MSGHSDFYGLATVFALGLALAFWMHRQDAKIWEESTAILTGYVGGRPVSIEYRRYMLYVGWFIHVGVMIATASVGTVAFVLLARSGDTEYVRVFAYICAVISGLSALGWSMQLPSWYQMLKKQLGNAVKDSP
jgi:hypothetical protein